MHHLSAQRSSSSAALVASGSRSAPAAVRLTTPAGPRCAIRSSSARVQQLPGSRSSLVVARAAPLDLSQLSQDQITAGAAFLATVLGVAVTAAATGGNLGGMLGGEGGSGADAAGAAADAVAAPPPLPRVNAVLVFGGTGKLGRRVVEQLVRAGRTVVVAARSQGKADEVFGEAGLQPGYQAPAEGASSGGSGGILIVEAGVDVTRPETLTPGLFKGVTQVVYALGPVAGRLPDGSFGYIDGMSPEAVETQGMAHILAALKQHVPQLAAAAARPQLAATSATTVLPMATAEDLETWERLDDVIMGGSSSSGLAPAEDSAGALWCGELVTEGGGFCGTRTKRLGGLDLSGYDGLQLRVKGDGQIFKFNIKTTDQEDTPESTYQATFDTSPDGDWTTVRLPWASFVPVKRAQSDPAGRPLGPSSISMFGLVLSRFEFNKMPNPSYRPGPFTLQIDGGIRGFTAPRPAVVAISSAGVERNAIIGDDAAARKADIPIVQLNPGGVLNWKYEAECGLRASGLPYTIIRCTGLDDRAIEGPALLEADQGDVISGKVSRSEAAATVVAALGRPSAAYKTLELRQSEAADAKGKEMSEAAFERLFLKLSLDRNRWRAGLRPFPRAVPPPPPPSEDDTKAILADPRVQAVRQRNAEQQQQQQPEGEQQQQPEGEQPEGQSEEVKEKELVQA